MTTRTRPTRCFQLGQLLESRGDIDGAHAAWQQAIDAGCEGADYWRERMSPAPGEPPEAAPYPPDPPPQFNPGNLVRTGIDVLEYGHPPGTLHQIVCRVRGKGKLTQRDRNAATR